MPMLPDWNMDMEQKGESKIVIICVTSFTNGPLPIQKLVDVMFEVKLDNIAVRVRLSRSLNGCAKSPPIDKH